MWDQCTYHCVKICTTTNIVCCHLVAMLLSATWNLHSMLDISVVRGRLAYCVLVQSSLCRCHAVVVIPCQWLSSHVIDPLSSCVSARCVRMNVGWGVLTRTTQPRQTMNLCCCSLFGCHIADSDMAPGFCIEEMIGRGR